MLSLFLSSLLQDWYFFFHFTKVLSACSHQLSGAVSFLCDLFPAAFSGTINNIRLFVMTSLYVATITIFYSSWDIDGIKCQLHVALNCQWCLTVASGFTLPTEKSHCLLFICLYDLHLPHTWSLVRVSLYLNFYVLCVHICCCRITVAELNHITSITVHKKKPVFPFFLSQKMFQIEAFEHKWCMNFISFISFCTVKCFWEMW